MRIFLSILIFLNLAVAFAASPYIAEPEDAIIEVIYKRKQITDTTSRQNSFFFSDDVMLRVGKNKSLFCGVERLWQDSIMKVDYPTYAAMCQAAYERDKENYFFLGGTYKSYIYKDKPKNEVSECDYFNLSRWKYKEDMQIPEWSISDSTKNCLGYECVMATTSFKGRHWIAWFTPEIPIADGPWKLCGLPGLILEAYDESHDYEFMPKAIYTSGIGPVGYMWYMAEDQYINVSRDKFFQKWRKNKLSDSTSQIKAAFGISTSAKEKKSGLNFDREETDYPHE